MFIEGRGVSSVSRKVPSFSRSERSSELTQVSPRERRRDVDSEERETFVSKGVLDEKRKREDRFELTTVSGSPCELTTTRYRGALRRNEILV